MKNQSKNPIGMFKLKYQVIAGAALLLIIFMFFCVKRIDAGHAGIRVNNYGDNKGVSQITEVTGWAWYFPFSQIIYEVPTYVQTANYRNDTLENVNTELRFNTKDGMVVKLDASLNYNTPTESVVKIFKKYRKPVTELEQTILRNKIVDAINSVCSHYNCEEVYEKRNIFESECKTHLKETLGKEGFFVEDFVILGELRLPKTVVHNINQKINACQIALTKQQEIQQQIFESQKKIATARGDSASAVIRAQGNAKSTIIEAEANSQAYKLENQQLSPLNIRKMYAERFNGQFPIGTTPNLFMEMPK